MHVDLVEGNVAGELEAQHDHPRDPQEEDVPGRGEHVGRVERPQLRRRLGPAERCEGPQRRGEPGVEHVRVALPAPARGRGLPDMGLLAPVPDGQLVAPPQLPRDAPGADVPHPVEVDLALALRVDAHAPGGDRLDRGGGQLVHAHEPLERDERLDALARAMREGNGVAVALAAGDPPLALERGDDRLAGLEHGQAGEALAGVRRHAPVLADHRDLVETVTAADLEVVGVVAGGDLQLAGAEVGLHVVVGDDRQPAPDERQDRRAPDQLAVALVVRVDRHRRVGQHRLGPHRGDRHLPAALEVVVDRVEHVVDLALLDLEVRDGRAAARVPVDDVAVAVDVALLVQVDEHPHDRARVGVVEREALLRVVAGRSEPLELLDDRRAVAAPATAHTRSTKASRPSSSRLDPSSHQSPSRPGSAWRSRRGRCRGSTSCARRASGDGGPARPGSSR